MKNKKGAMAVAWIIGVVAILFIGMFGFIAYQQGWFAKQEISGSTSTQQIIAQSNEGKASTLKIQVRDLAQTNINTKKAVSVYCAENVGGEWKVLSTADAVTSSTTTTINVPTTQGKQIKCWAFNSTFQTAVPYELTTDEEIETIVIDGYSLPTNGELQVANNLGSAFGTGGVVNVTGVGADTTGTLAKMRFKNNNTNTIYPLGGIYFAQVASSNVSDITLNGGGTLSMKHSSYLPAMTATSLEVSKSELANAVSSRQDNWDKVFEVNSGNVILLEGGDYVETGTVSVKGDGDGCSSTGELISTYAFTKGYYRSSLTDQVLYGHQTDASSASVVSTDVTGGTFYCTA